MASTAASGSPVVTTAARVGAATVRRSTRAWRRYCLRKLQQIASAADALLPPADQAEQESLLASLNEAAAVGIRPVRGFDVPGARAGYTRVRLQSRAGRVADCLYLANVDGEAPWVDAALRRLLVDADPQRICRVLSVGGGPAFDLVAMAILCDVVFADYATRKSVQGPQHGVNTNANDAGASECFGDPVRVEATVLDYEAGWKKCAMAVANALTECTLSSSTQKQKALPQPPASCKACHAMQKFGRCDINAPLTAEVNSAAAQVVYEQFGEVPDAAGDADNRKDTRQSRRPIVVVASYVVAENAEGLRRTNFCFFRDLMREAAPGSLFVFAETTHRLWPELLRIAFEEFFLWADKDPCMRSQPMSRCDLTHVPTRETFLVAFPWRIQHGSALLLGKPFLATNSANPGNDGGTHLQPTPVNNMAGGEAAAVAVGSSSAPHTRIEYLQSEPLENEHDWIDAMIESLLSDKDRRKLHQFRLHKERHRSKAQLLAQQRAASSASASASAPPQTH